MKTPLIDPIEDALLFLEAARGSRRMDDWTPSEMRALRRLSHPIVPDLHRAMVAEKNGWSGRAGWADINQVESWMREYERSAGCAETKSTPFIPSPGDWYEMSQLGGPWTKPVRATQEQWEYREQKDTVYRRADAPTATCRECGRTGPAGYCGGCRSCA